MQDGILKFPKALKENKNVSNELITKTPKNMPNESSFRPKKREKENIHMSKEELEAENRFLMESIRRNEKKMDNLSKNDKIKEFFDVKSFVNDNYKEFVDLLEDYKNLKIAENNQKDRFFFFFVSKKILKNEKRRGKLENFLKEESKKTQAAKNAEKTAKNLEEKIRRLNEDVIIINFSLFLKKNVVRWKKCKTKTKNIMNN